MDDIYIELRPEWMQSLRDHTQEGSTANAALWNTFGAVSLYGISPDEGFSCDDDTAATILQAAKEHCPQAVPIIQRDIDRAHAGRRLKQRLTS